MAKNYVLLETVTVGAAGASSITFNSIPQTGYTDLKIVASTRTTTTDTGLFVYFNGDTTNANYSTRRILGNGSAASSASYSAPYWGYTDASSDTANTFSNTEIYIPNYTDTTNKQSISSDSVTENNATGATATLNAGLWNTNSAITSVSFYTISGSFVQYSTFSLYGLAAVGTTPTVAPKASGGDIIQTDGTYWYHAFLYSGTFTPQKSLNCSVLQIAGGGGGGNTRAGGGGAGGLVYTASVNCSTSSYTVTIGGGGAGATTGLPGSNGSASSLAGLSLTSATGGGGGGTAQFGGTAAYANGQNGGSGGGSAYTTTGGPSTAGTGSQGYNGGLNYAGGEPYGGGGGGGAGSAGVNANGSNCGNGGTGSSTYSSWGSATGTGQNVSGTYYYAGGGGGGTYVRYAAVKGVGGYGGGADGGDTGIGGTGVANTGGGGGGGGNTDAQGFAGGAGGSGIVIIRYPVTA